MKRFCLVCGQELNGSKRILCSPECRLEYYKTPRVIACQKCGRVISVTGRRNVCRECMLEHWRQYSNSPSAAEKRQEKYRSYNKLHEEEIKKAEEEKPKPQFSLDDYIAENAEREKKGLPRVSYGQWVIQKENIKVKVDITNMSKSAKSENKGTGEYIYGMRMRGFAPGCQPMDGLLMREDDPTGAYYALLMYDRPLTQIELRDYDLDLI